MQRKVLQMAYIGSLYENAYCKLLAIRYHVAMKDASNTILETLRGRGYRITKARTEVVKQLIASPTPLSIQGLFKKVTVDEVSVYRTIELLLAEGLLEEVPTKGTVPTYALFHGHHHHVVCTSCQKVAHVECGNAKIVVPKDVPGFSKLDTHELTFYGVCNACT